MLRHFPAAKRLPASKHFTAVTRLSAGKHLLAVVANQPAVKHLPAVTRLSAITQIPAYPSAVQCTHLQLNYCNFIAGKAKCFVILWDFNFHELPAKILWEILVCSNLPS